MLLGKTIPSVTFKTRVRDESLSGDNPFKWKEVNSSEIFSLGKRIVAFSLPGAFTPTCSNEQCPAFERLHEAFIELGVDEIYCIAVNDAFVMYQWFLKLGAKKTKFLPDG